MRHVSGAQYLEPAGWAAIEARYWPVGIYAPTLRLRICGKCFEAARQEIRP
jgi:hypothetical protein